MLVSPDEYKKLILLGPMSGSDQPSVPPISPGLVASLIRGGKLERVARCDFDFPERNLNNS